jgi:hypothetical protein
MNVGNHLASLGMITHNLQLNDEHADAQRASNRAAFDRFSNRRQGKWMRQKSELN